MEVFVPGDHGSTFGGNPLGAAVALAALAEFETGGYGERVTDLGNKAFAALRNFDHPAIEDIRGRGLLIGVEVKEGVDTYSLSKELTKRGILTKETRNRTFRLTPPLTIEEDTLMQAIERVKQSIEAVG
jgi:ornithine--oxo-acid transaminase